MLSPQRKCPECDTWNAEIYFYTADVYKHEPEAYHCEKCGYDEMLINNKWHKTKGENIDEKNDNKGLYNQWI